MGSEYTLATDAFLDANIYPFTNALQNAPNQDISIVIHGTGDGSTDAQQVANYFASPENKDHNSTHFIVGQSGDIVQCIHLKDGAGGNCCATTGYDTFWTPFLNKYGNLNRCTISIEHCSDVNNSSYTGIQLTESFRLVRWLCEQFHITADHIKTHASIDPIDRAHCPGNYPMNSLISFIKDGGKMAPRGWTYKIENGDTHLYAPNGHYVRGGFLTFIEQHAWNADDMPLEPETGILTPVEMSNPELGPGVRQAFTFTTLEMLTSQGNRIIKGWTGQERLYLGNMVTQLQASINQFKLPPTLDTDLTAAAQAISRLQQDINNAKAQGQTA